MNTSFLKISSKTNWKKVLTKMDEEIDFSDSPEVTDEFMALAQREPALATLEVEPMDAQTHE